MSAAVEVGVATSHDVRQRPGHTTDPREVTWRAERLAPGLSKPRCVPPPALRAWRALPRPRVSLVQTRPPAKHRVYKLVEDTPIQLASGVSEVCGKRARRLWEALVAGARDAAKLSALALGSVRRKMPQLAVALAGQWTAHPAKRIAGAREWVEVLGRQMAERDQPRPEWRGPLAPQREQLDRMPGVHASTARDSLAELGLDQTRFGSAARLAAWAGLSPGNNARAGQRRTGRTRQGKRSLRRVGVQWAWATRQTATLLGRTFRRLEARVGGKTAAVAVMQKIVGIIDPLLLEGPVYEEERSERLVPSQEARARQRALKALERLGSTVTVEQGPSSAGVAHPITLRGGLRALHAAQGATPHGSGVPKRRWGFRGKFTALFAPPRRPRPPQHLPPPAAPHPGHWRAAPRAASAHRLGLRRRMG